MFKAALTWPASSDELAAYRSYVSSECQVVAPESDSLEAMVEAARDADALVGSHVPQAMIDVATRLRLVQMLNSGVTHATLEGQDMGFSFASLIRRDITLCNIVGPSAVPCAEHTFALMLALAKRLVPSHRAIAREEESISTTETMGTTLAGKTLGVLGMGAIGIQLAKRAVAFDMRVVGTKRTPAPHLVGQLGLDFLGTPDDLTRVLEESDFVAVCVPWMPSTDGMIGEAELRSMKTSAFLVNIARANMVDEDALYRALTEGWIAGFATDVWWNYDVMRGSSDETTARLGFGLGGDDTRWTPLPHRPPGPVPYSRTGVHRLDNVTVTADRGVWNAETLPEIPREGLQNVDRLARGERPNNILDLGLRTAP